MNIPLIMGAIYKYEGQVTVFNYGENPVNYRDVFPVPPESGEIPNCSETGVLGVLPGLIGTLQAAEAIKLVTGIGNLLTGRMLFYNLRSAGFYEVAIHPGLEGRANIPEDLEAFRNYDYNITCGRCRSISWEKALDWSSSLVSSVMVDIREPGEEPMMDREEVRKIPMRDLMEDCGVLHGYENIILFCKSGKRSEKLAVHLKDQFPEKKVFSIEGGILHPSSPLNSSEI